MNYMNAMIFETVAERINEDCGCPEHDISMQHITATVHVEPDGTGEAFVDFGDWEEEWHFDSVKGIEDLKQKAWDRFTALPLI